MRPFTGLGPSKLNFVSKKFNGMAMCIMYIEESFDTLFNMGYGGGGLTTPPPHNPYCIIVKKKYDKGTKKQFLFT